MWQSFVHFELLLCRMLNRGCKFHGVHTLFAVVSRLGNGVAWYSLMLALPLAFGRQGLMATLHMLVVGLCGLGIYLAIKQSTERPRPFSICGNIRQGAVPLDRYSFPSGHTMHAVSLTVVALHYLPMLMWVLVPFVILVAISRVVLGLHYPTDVFCGALIGFLLATGSLLWFSGFSDHSSMTGFDADFDDF